MNHFMRAVLKALSYPDINSKKNYKAERVAVNLLHPHLLRPYYKIWDHKITADGHDIPIRIFSPQVAGDFPVLIFFHGGGWVTGNIDSYDKVCTNLAQLTQHTVVSVDYRLAPEHPFPAGLEDCYFATREIIQILGTAKDKITLVGDSAGANLAAAVSLLARDRGEFLPASQILIYPAVNNDHTANSPYASVRDNGEGYLLTSKRICDYMEMYKSCNADVDSPYFAPLLADDFSNQPDTLILTAEYDPLRDEGEAYGEKLAQAGNRVKIFRIHDVLHGFFSLPASYGPVKKSYRLINRFLSEVESK